MVKKIKELKADVNLTGGGSFASFGDSNGNQTSSEEILESYVNKFNNYLFDDLNTPRALATMWEALKDAGLSNKDKLGLIANSEDVFSLGLTGKSQPTPLIPADFNLLKSKGGLEYDRLQKR